MGRDGISSFPTLEEIQYEGDEIFEEWRRKATAYYYKEVQYISDNRGPLVVEKRGIFYIYNLDNEKIMATHTQRKEILPWFNKKYFQLFSEMLINFEARRKSDLHCFAAKVKAL